MKFEWDEDKNLSNFRKHGIWFEEAKLYGPMNRASSFSILNTAKTRIGTFGLAIPAFIAYCWWFSANVPMAMSSV